MLTQKVKLMMMLCSVKCDAKSHCEVGQTPSGLPQELLGETLPVLVRTSSGTLLSFLGQKYMLTPSLSVRFMTNHPPPLLLRPCPYEEVDEKDVPQPESPLTFALQSVVSAYLMMGRSQKSSCIERSILIKRSNVPFLIPIVRHCAATRRMERTQVDRVRVYTLKLLLLIISRLNKEQ